MLLAEEDVSVGHHGGGGEDNSASDGDGGREGRTEGRKERERETHRERERDRQTDRQTDRQRGGLSPNLSQLPPNSKPEALIRAWFFAASGRPWCRSADEIMPAIARAHLSGGP